MARAGACPGRGQGGGRDQGLRPEAVAAAVGGRPAGPGRELRPGAAGKGGRRPRRRPLALPGRAAAQQAVPPGRRTSTCGTGSTASSGALALARRAPGGRRAGRRSNVAAGEGRHGVAAPADVARPWWTRPPGAGLDVRGADGRGPLGVGGGEPSARRVLPRRGRPGRQARAWPRCPWA